MVKTGRKDYEATNLDNDGKRTKTEMEPTTTGDDGMAGTATAISTKALKEILAESQRYVSPPRPLTSTPMATKSATYQRTPVTHRIMSQPRFGTPTFWYTQSYGSTRTMTAMEVTTATGTPILTPVKAETAMGDSFDIEDGMVIVSYTRSAANPRHWEPVKITLNEFKERYTDKQTAVKKRVAFEDEAMGKTATKKLKFTVEEEELMKKIEDWAAANKKLTGSSKYGDDDDDSDREKNRYDKTATERKTIMTKATGDEQTGLTKGMGEGTGNTYENKLAFVRNIPKLPEKEHLTGANNYDGWSSKMKMFFTAFDVIEYLEKPLDEIRETDKIRQQLDAATLLVIHGSISSALQQVVNNEVHAYEAWETLQKLYTSNTIQELVNIGAKMVD